MSTLSHLVQEAMSSLTQCVDEGNRVAVPTHYLYPSRSSVTVYVTSVHHGMYVVSDNGGAIDTISAHGFDVEDPDKFLLPFCRGDGLHANDGKIITPRLAIGAIPIAVLAVADASAKAAHQGVHNTKPKGRRDLVGAVRHELAQRFHGDRVREGERFLAASSRQYKFDFRVQLEKKQTLLVDAVLPDPNSINAKVAAHIDVGRLEDKNIIQRIVYDPAANWNSADLNFLQSVSKTIALSSFGPALNPFVLH